MNSFAMIRKASEQLSALASSLPANPRLPVAPAMSADIADVYGQVIRDWPRLAPAMSCSTRVVEAAKPVAITMAAVKIEVRCTPRQKVLCVCVEVCTINRLVKNQSRGRISTVWPLFISCLYYFFLSLAAGGGTLGAFFLLFVVSWNAPQVYGAPPTQGRAGRVSYLGNGMHALPGEAGLRHCSRQKALFR